MESPSAWARLGEGGKNGSQASRSATVIKDMFSACDKIQARFADAERIPDHKGRQGRPGVC
jgi:hypothetical protein